MVNDVTLISRQYPYRPAFIAYESGLYFHANQAAIVILRVLGVLCEKNTATLLKKMI
jgi:hypothetical protein